MKNMLKTLLLWLLDISGFNALSRYINRKKALILMYHGICADDFSLFRGYDARQLPKSVFKKQLMYLQRKGYIFANMTQLTNIIKNRDKISKLVVLTFDDGFNNVFKNAYSLIKEFHAKGCFYLVSGLLGTNELLWTDFIEMVIRNHKKDNFQFIFKGETINYHLSNERSYQFAVKDIKSKLRSISDKERLGHLEQFNTYKIENVSEELSMAAPDQIMQIDQNILEIGSHTKTHPNCANLTSNEELEQEVVNSKTDLEKIPGIIIKHFCYPAGSYNKNVIGKVIEAGYQSAVTTKYGFNDYSSGLYELKRMEASDKFLLFKADVSGSYLLIKRIKTIVMNFTKCFHRGRA